MLYKASNAEVVFVGISDQAQSLLAYADRKIALNTKLITNIIAQAKLTSSEVERLLIGALYTGNLSHFKIFLTQLDHKITPAIFRSLLIHATEARLNKILEYLCLKSEIPLGIKFKAVTPAIYSELNGSIRSNSTLSQLGAYEVEIRKRYHEYQNAVRAQKYSAPTLKSSFSKVLAKYREGELDQSSAQIVDTHLNPDTSTSLSKQQIVTEHKWHWRNAELRVTEQPIIRKANIKKQRETNPNKLIERLSFMEVLEKTFSKFQLSKVKRRFSINTVIARSLEVWSGEKPFTRSLLSCHMQNIHPDGQTITNPNLYSWKNRPWKAPYRSSINIIVEAFRLQEKHELMLWRIANRHRPRHSIDYFIKNAESALNTKYERRARASLVRALVNQSGISHARLEELLDVQQLSMWKIGAKIEAHAVAKRFVDLVLATSLVKEKDFARHADRAKRVYSLVHGSSVSISHALEESKQKANPSGYFLKKLTGRNGIAPTSIKKIAKLLGVSKDRAQRMRNTYKVRGGRIFERHAEIIADYLQGITPAERNDLGTEEKVERDILLEGLTVVPSAIKLYGLYQSGDLPHPGEILKLTRKRKGVTQISGTSDFELGKSKLGIRKAIEIANFLEYYEQHPTIRREFILEATGYIKTRNPLMILEQAEKHEICKHIALRLLLNQTGKTRAQSAESIGISHHIIQHLVTKHSGGQTNKLSIAIALAKEVGLSQHEDRFIKVFYRRYNLNSF